MKNKFLAFLTVMMARRNVLKSGKLKLEVLMFF